MADGQGFFEYYRAAPTWVKVGIPATFVAAFGLAGLLGSTGDDDDSPSTPTTGVAPFVDTTEATTTTPGPG
jgi:hypothetical protein